MAPLRRDFSLPARTSELRRSMIRLPFRTSLEASCALASAPDPASRSSLHLVSNACRIPCGNHHSPGQIEGQHSETAATSMQDQDVHFGRRSGVTMNFYASVLFAELGAAYSPISYSKERHARPGLPWSTLHAGCWSKLMKLSTWPGQARFSQLLLVQPNIGILAPRQITRYCPAAEQGRSKVVLPLGLYFSHSVPE